MPGSGASKEGGEEAWHDVDIVKTTVYTVTGYQVPKDPTVKATEVSVYCSVATREMVGCNEIHYLIVFMTSRE